MKCLEYPFDSSYLLMKKKRIKKELKKNSSSLIKKKIAILGGSTTNDIKLMMELFLLNQGIEPEFYESEYNQYYEEAVFPNQNLIEFSPDIIYIHTCSRNIVMYPTISDTEAEVERMLLDEINKFKKIWITLEEAYHCPIIQNNFEYLPFRLLGNRDASDKHGRINFITRLNMMFYEYAQNHNNFYINDINYVSACYGIDKWADLSSWYMFKYCCAIEAIPDLAFNITKIIKSIFGKNKKGMVLDLDNTLWGGVIGDDGVDNIVLGPETAEGEAYCEFQNYIKSQKQIGVILNIASKNERENALAGLKHPESTLSKDDFIIIKANWEPKNINFLEISEELKLLPESLVFVDDNPVERVIVTSDYKNTISAPELDRVDNYIRLIDKCGFFEVTALSQDDIQKSEMYRANLKRSASMTSFVSYRDYLISLQMTATIKAFEPIYIARISQLTNKSNQFNLTTRRYTIPEIESLSSNSNYITLYGKLSDRFGDNGVVSVVIGEIKEEELWIELWIMSCRVLKRDMEFAMMDTLATKCLERGVKTIRGFYYPTTKNKMVKDFYSVQGFKKDYEDEAGNSRWSFRIDSNYIKKNTTIQMED